MRLAPAALLVALALSGCVAEKPAAAAPRGPVVEGWVLDEALRPIGGATVALLGSELEARTAANGRYALEVPAGAQVTVTARAPGFEPKSGFLGSGFGARAHLNFSLVRVPVAQPHTQLQDHKGQLTCAVSAVVGQDDPDRPHQHMGARCSELPVGVDDGNAWLYPVPQRAAGVVLEVFWTPNSPLSETLVLQMIVAATGETIGFAEGPSPIQVHLGQARVAQLQERGQTDLRLAILPGAGTGSHEHGAVGAFAEQPFRIFATAFFNQPLDPTYSVSGN